MKDEKAAGPSDIQVNNLKQKDQKGIQNYQNSKLKIIHCRIKKTCEEQISVNQSDLTKL